MSDEKSAKKWVEANIKETKKGYRCPLPVMYAYPNGPVKLDVGGGFNVPERMQELLDQFNTEVARREAEKGDV